MRNVSYCWWAGPVPERSDRYRVNDKYPANVLLQANPERSQGTHMPFHEGLVFTQYRSEATGAGLASDLPRSTSGHTVAGQFRSYTGLPSTLVFNCLGRWGRSRSCVQFTAERGGCQPCTL